MTFDNLIGGLADPDYQSKIGVDQLCASLKQVRKAYGKERRLILGWDLIESVSTLPGAFTFP